MEKVDLLRTYALAVAELLAALEDQRKSMSHRAVIRRTRAEEEVKALTRLHLLPPLSKSSPAVLGDVPPAAAQPGEGTVSS